MIFSGIKLPKGGGRIYLVLDWLSGKKYEVSFSSIGAEIFAAETAADKASLLAERLQSLFHGKKPMKLVLTMESFRLCSIISTLHEGTDYRLHLLSPDLEIR